MLHNRGVQITTTRLLGHLHSWDLTKNTPHNALKPLGRNSTFSQVKNAYLTLRLKLLGLERYFYL